MSGMNSGLNVTDPTVVAAFHAALIHQGIIALVIFAVLAGLWLAAREWTDGQSAGAAAGAGGPAEPAWRQLLRYGFGFLWLIDGILQAQSGMPAGLPSQVIEPTAASSPHWVQAVVNWAGTGWSYHPIQAAAATVWIQVGIGIWLLTAKRGRLSRLGGLASVGWGLVVWVFGESFGGIFAPGLSWLTGAPGAATVYFVAGLLIALPTRWWRSPRLGRLVLAGMGLFLAGMAVLQAWPGRGFWQGSYRGQPGTLTSMVQTMSGISQPSALSDLLSGFAGVVRTDGFVVNLAAVVALAAIAAAMIAAGLRPGWHRLARLAVVALAVLCAADWLLVQDLGIFGGLGTDPNSMIPMAVLAAAGYLALVGAAVPATAPEAAADQAEADQATAEQEGAAPGAVSWRQRLRPAGLRAGLAAAGLGTVTGIGAIAVVVLGVVPMAAAQASQGASPILAQAIDGSSAPLGDSPAPAITLTDQHGNRVSLASLRGKAVLLTFLDPVCVTDCPLIAQEFRQAGQLLAGSRVELVAVNLNPLYSRVAYLQAFDRQENLAAVPNWLYLTGSPAQLRQVWKEYGVASETAPAGAMLAHSDTAYVIDPRGRLYEELDIDPGPGTQATQASFATELAAAARQAQARS